MIECAGFEECNVKSGSKALVHVFVDDVVSLASDETGLEEIVAKLTHAGIGTAAISVGDSCIRCAEQ